MFLSPKTIEVHLSRAYRKLGVRTRTELSRRIASHRATGSSRAPLRTLSTVLCSDVVKPAGDAAVPGDKPQAVSVASHDQEVAAALKRNRGRLVRAAGDGVLAMFDTPSEALRCAFDICAAARHVDVQARAAVHLGEIDSFPDGEIRGISVRIAELILGHAGTGEVLVTQTVRDAVYGSSLVFRSRGEIDLAGVGNWNLFAAIPQ